MIRVATEQVNESITPVDSHKINETLEEVSGIDSLVEKLAELHGIGEDSVKELKVGLEEAIVTYLGNFLNKMNESVNDGMLIIYESLDQVDSVEVERTLRSVNEVVVKVTNESISGELVTFMNKDGNITYTLGDLVNAEKVDVGVLIECWNSEDASSVGKFLSEIIKSVD